MTTTTTQASPGDAPISSYVAMAHGLHHNLQQVLLGAPVAVTVAVWPPSRGATSWSKTCRAWARRCWPRRWPCRLGADLSRVQGHPDLSADRRDRRLGLQPRDPHLGLSTRARCSATWCCLDELNRTPPRTQSALLEAMEEQQVSVDGETWALPHPHLVLATQNPIGQMGTFPSGGEPARSFLALDRARLSRRRHRDPVGAAPRRP